MSLSSMTGHADRSGTLGGVGWTWEARSVNGRGLDLRLRLPEGFEPIEAAIRSSAAAHLSRGSVAIVLRVSGDATSRSAPRVNEAALDAALAQLAMVRARADAIGLELAPPSASDLLGLRGVLDADADPGATDPALIAAVADQFADLLDGLVAARRAEGAALGLVLSGQIDRIEAAVAAAQVAASRRGARVGEALRARVDAVLEAKAPVDPDRLAQELALIAVKADVREELDRLEAHVAAARALLVAEGPVGRKLEFLTQEFNREASTLCAKSGAPALTAIGLDLKVVVDQMREQAQNVE